jgi:hypothetical protein
MLEPLNSHSLAIRNKMPKGRSAVFAEGETVRLVKRAWRKGRRGLACIMATAWDTQFSPVDCRTIVSRHWFADPAGSFFSKFRKKMEATDPDAVEAIGTLSRRTGTDLLPDPPMFRNLAGTAYSKDALCRAFRKNLVEVLPGDKRKLMHFRRSGAHRGACR